MIEMNKWNEKMKWKMNRMKMKLMNERKQQKNEQIIELNEYKEWVK